MVTQRSGIYVSVRESVGTRSASVWERLANGKYQFAKISKPKFISVWENIGTYA